MNTQLAELMVAYAVTAAGMLVGLIAMRAGSHAYWRWPVYSAMVMALGVVLWNLLRAHLLPPQWTVAHANTLYYCALGLYSMLGLALGVLLGRLTGRKSVESNPGERE